MALLVEEIGWKSSLIDGSLTLGSGSFFFCSIRLFRSCERFQNSAMSTDQSTTAKPSADELEDIILSARYGELEEIQAFVAKYGIASIADNVDERGNGCLHMAAANGHNG